MTSQIRTAEDNLVPGDIIVANCHTYEVQSFLGEGSFGKVVKCVRSKDDKTVAVKVLKKEGRYHDQAKAEVSVDIFESVCVMCVSVVGSVKNLHLLSSTPCSRSRIWI